MGDNEPFICIVDTVVVDDLGNQGAKTSSATVFTWPQFYQTRSAWSMDQGSTKKRSAVHNFVLTVTKFCVMWEGLSLPQDTKFGNCRDEIVDRRVIFIWSLIHGSSWSGLIKVGPGLLKYSVFSTSRVNTCPENASTLIKKKWTVPCNDWLCVMLGFRCVYSWVSSWIPVQSCEILLCFMECFMAECYAENSAYDIGFHSNPFLCIHTQTYLSM